MNAVASSPAHLLTVVELDANPWASCGPAALAALLGRSLADIRHAFPRQTEASTWTNLAMMGRALAALGARHSATGTAPDLEHPAKLWPRHGLVLIQFCGSWSQMPVSHPAQLQRSHWIAVMNARGASLSYEPAVFDINLVAAGHSGWVTREGWDRTVAPQLAEHFGKKATGQWWVRAGIEVK